MSRGHPVAAEESVEGAGLGVAGEVRMAGPETCWGRPPGTPAWALWEEHHAESMERFSREASASGRSYGDGGGGTCFSCLPCGRPAEGAWRTSLGGGGLVFAPVPSGHEVEGAEALPRVLVCGPSGGGKTRLLRAVRGVSGGVGGPKPTEEFVLHEVRVPVGAGFVPFAASSSMPRQSYVAFAQSGKEECGSGDGDSPGSSPFVGGEGRVHAVEAGGGLGVREWARAMLSGPADAVCFVVRGSSTDSELADAGVMLRELLRWCRPTLRRNRVPVLVAATIEGEGGGGVALTRPAHAPAVAPGERLVAALELDFETTRHSPLALRVVDLAEKETLLSCMRWLVSNASRGAPDGSQTFGRRELLRFDDGGVDEVASYVSGYVDADKDYARLRAEVERDRKRQSARVREALDQMAVVSVPPSPSKVDLILPRDGDGEFESTSAQALDDIDESDNEVYDLTPRQSPVPSVES